ncbi:MAG: hypothetical protein WAM05_14435, partial [Candidatus Binataceae bacterium]
IVRRATFTHAKIFTTIRNAGDNFIVGRSMERGEAGKPFTLRERLYGYGFALAERLRLVTSPLVGEELIAEIRK